jgi:PAS domain S-box-containing protein
MWIVDVNTQAFLAVNDAAIVRYGYSRAEFFGMKIADIHLKEDLHELVEFLDLAATTPMLTERQHIWRHRVRGGKVILVDSTVCRINFTGRMALLFVVLDETERMSVENRTRRSNVELEKELAEKTRELELAGKVLDSFSYLVSHDMRSPLLVIDGFGLELAEQNGGELNEQGMHFVGRIRQSAQHMSKLIDEMLLLAKVTRVPLAPETVDLTTMCNSIVEELQAREPNRSVSVDIQDGMQCVGDAMMVRLVLANLLENAWKFTSRRAEPWVTVGRKDMPEREGPVFFVSDNGAGFDMAYADKLFVAFRRLHSTREFPGTGVGLAIAQRIVARHGGEIWAESQLAVGATFYFTLGRHMGTTSPD